MADFDDFFRPLRNYLHWEPHCYNIPLCWSVRSMFDSRDGINAICHRRCSTIPTSGAPWTFFISPDGKSLRKIISHRDDPASGEGLSRVEPIQLAAIEALKGTPLEDAKVSLGGTAATYHDLAQGSRYDLGIAESPRSA